MAHLKQRNFLAGAPKRVMQCVPSIAVVTTTVTVKVSVEPTHCLPCKNPSDLQNDSDSQELSRFVDAPFVHRMSASQSTLIDRKASSSGTESSIASSEPTRSSLLSSAAATTRSLSLTTAVVTAPSSAASSSAAPSSTPSCLPTVPPLACYRFRTDFPSVDKWISWECLVSVNKATLLMHNGPDEADEIIASVEAVAKKAGIDPRVAFAVVMQESNGMLRHVQRISDRVGMFQGLIPEATGCEGTKMNECSAETITMMAEKGIYGHVGTASSPLKPSLAFWIVTQDDIALGLRGYNSRSIINENDLTIVPLGERSYVSDIANRLVGAKFGARRRFSCLN